MSKIHDPWISAWELLGPMGLGGESFGSACYFKHNGRQAIVSLVVEVGVEPRTEIRRLNADLVGHASTLIPFALMFRRDENSAPLPRIVCERDGTFAWAPEAPSAQSLAALGDYIRRWMNAVQP